MTVRRGVPPAVYLVLALLVLGGTGFVLWWCQHVPPVKVVLSRTPTALGPESVLSMQATATRGGVRWVEVSLAQGDVETTLARREFTDPAATQQLDVEISGGALALQEGPATLRIHAADGFFRPFGASDAPAVELPVTLDFTPPRLSVVSASRYPRQGGAGIAIVDADEPVQVHLTVGEASYPAFAVNDADRRHVGLYAIPWDQAKDVAIAAVAADAAGNETTLEIPVTLRHTQFAHGTVTLQRDFLLAKIPELLPGRVVNTDEEVAAAFLEINRDLRGKAAQVKRDLSQKTASHALWHGAFVQPRNTRVFSNFAELRDYTFDGKPVDREPHLGFDLASIRQAAVPAANAGVVVYAGPLNIYGNAVVIDHGLGLQTLYGHMSSIDVAVGDTVAKQQTLGHTGATGLAVGDHLHYEVLVHGVPVSPLEWWDPDWVRDHIEQPMADAGLVDAPSR